VGKDGIANAIAPPKNGYHIKEYGSGTLLLRTNFIPSQTLHHRLSILDSLIGFLSIY
jgi:hypothetical protein